MQANGGQQCPPVLEPWAMKHMDPSASSPPSVSIDSVEKCKGWTKGVSWR